MNDEFIGRLSYIHNEKGKWSVFLILFVIPCIAAFELRDYFGKKVDVLSGKSAIDIFLRNNRIGILAIAILTAIYIFVLIRMRGIHREDSIFKVISVFGAAIMLAFTLVSFILSGNNIYDDYKSATVYDNDEYVLCTSFSGAEELYYIGFEQKGDYMLLQIPEDTYDELSEGEESTEDAASDEIYSMIEEAGYNDATRYSSDVKVSYYFNSAILESAELKKSA